MGVSQPRIGTVIITGCGVVPFDVLKAVLRDNFYEVHVKQREHDFGPLAQQWAFAGAFGVAINASIYFLVFLPRAMYLVQGKMHHYFPWLAPVLGPKEITPNGAAVLSGNGRLLSFILLTVYTLYVTNDFNSRKKEIH